MTAIKVAYILTPITFGGAEKISLNFLRTVDRTRFDIAPVLLLRPWEEPPLFAQEIVKLGYEYITLPVSIKQGGDPFRVLRVAWRLLKMLNAGNFNLVHTHGYFADICAIPVARMLGIKTMTTCHGFIANDQKLKLYNRLDTYAIKASNRVIAVSEGIKHQLAAAGVKQNKITVIPNAVETELDAGEIAHWCDSKRRELQINDGEFVVGFLGRLSAEKGVNFLIDAIADLIEDGLSIRLLIVGDGGERQNLETQVAQRNIAQRVTFTGFQTDTQIWLSAFDLFVLPSLTEGTPMALLEAMAMGVPVVVSNVGGVPKVISNKISGTLVEPGDIKALINAIKSICADGQLVDELVKNALDSIRLKYDVKPWCKTIEKTYFNTAGKEIC